MSAVAAAASARPAMVLFTAYCEHADDGAGVCCFGDDAVLKRMTGPVNLLNTHTHRVVEFALTQRPHTRTILLLLFFDLRVDFSFAYFLSPHAKETRRRCKRRDKKLKIHQAAAAAAAVAFFCSDATTHTHSHSHRETYFVKDALGAQRVHTQLCEYIRLFHTPLSSSTKPSRTFLTRSRLLFLFIFVIHFSPPFGCTGNATAAAVAATAAVAIEAAAAAAVAAFSR